MKTFYAIEYASGRDTTTGDPNPKTGCRNIAIRAKVFDSYYDRNSWVLAGAHTLAMQGNCREAATLMQLRRLTLGLSFEQFSECVKHLHYVKRVSVKLKQRDDQIQLQKLKKTKPAINTAITSDPSTPPNSPLSPGE